MKFKSEVYTAKLSQKNCDFTNKVSEVIEANKFGFNRRKEQAVLNTIQALYKKGEILHVLLLLQQQSKSLSWLKHRRFRKHLKAFHNDICTELFEDGRISKKDLAELRQTFAMADAYKANETQKVVPGKTNYRAARKQTITDGPGACEAVSTYYSMLADVTKNDVSLCYESEFVKPGFWARLKERWIMYREGLKRGEKLHFTRVHRPEESHNEKARIISTCLSYFASAKDQTNDTNKAKLLQLCLAKNSYEQACSLIIELLPRYTEFKNLKAYSKTYHGGKVIQGDLSLITELHGLLNACHNRYKSKEVYQSLLNMILANQEAMARLTSLADDANHGGASLTADQMLELNNIIEKLNDQQRKKETAAARQAVHATVGRGSSARSPDSSDIDDMLAIQRRKTLDLVAMSGDAHGVNPNL